MQTPTCRISETQGARQGHRWKPQPLDKTGQSLKGNPDIEHFI